MSTSASPRCSSDDTYSARAIAKEAYVYGFPMVDSYRVQYAYFVNKENPEYKPTPKRNAPVRTSCSMSPSCNRRSAW